MPPPTTLAADAGVSDLVRVYIDNLTVSYGDDQETVQLVVVPEGESLEGYVSLVADDGSEVSLDDAQVAITKNAEQVMGFAVGDELGLQDSTLAEGAAAPGAIVPQLPGQHPLHDRGGLRGRGSGRSWSPTGCSPT